MKIKQLSIACIFMVLSLAGMHKPINIQIPVIVANESNFVSTILLGATQADATLRNFMLIQPDSTLDVNNLKPGNDIRIITNRGHFIIAIYGDQIKLSALEPQLHLRSIQNAPVANVAEVIVTIGSNGIPFLRTNIMIPKPNDGRPDVPLSVYKALTGKESYASPYEILGTTPGMDTKKAYREKTLQWHPDKNKSPEAVSAIQLINWAAERLGVK